MHTVLRVETDDGKGPYGCGLNLTYDMFCHPLPHVDGLRKFPEHYKFGFSNFEQFNNWFGEYIEDLFRLTDEGYKLKVFRAKRVKKGKKQLVFERETAEEICSIPLILRIAQCKSKM